MPSDPFLTAPGPPTYRPRWRAALLKVWRMIVDPRREEQTNDASHAQGAVSRANANGATARLEHASVLPRRDQGDCSEDKMLADLTELEEMSYEVLHEKALRRRR